MPNAHRPLIMLWMLWLMMRCSAAVSPCSLAAADFGSTSCAAAADGDDDGDDSEAIFG